MGRTTGAFCGALVYASRRAEVAPPGKEIEIFPTTTLPSRSPHIFCFSDRLSLKNRARKFRRYGLTSPKRHQFTHVVIEEARLTGLHNLCPHKRC